MWIFGGCNDAGMFNNDFCEYKIHEQTWSKMKLTKNTPSARVGFSFFNFWNDIFIFGGYLDTTTKLKDYYQYSISRDEDYLDLKMFSPILKPTQTPSLLSRQHTTTVVRKNSFTNRAFLIGGRLNAGGWNDEIIVHDFYDMKKPRWYLHFLLATQIRALLGFNMCQEIIELLER